MYVEEKQLKSFVLDSGLASKTDLSTAEAEARKKRISVGEALVNQGRISEDDLRRLRAYALGVPFVDLRSHKPPFEVLSLIPEPIARNHNVVAFKKSDDTLEVALLDVDDLAAIEFLKKKVGLRIAPRLTDAESIRSALLSYQKALKAEFGDVIGREAAALRANAFAAGDQSESVSVVRIVDTLIRHAIVQRATDIHIEPREAELAIRYRIDGRLRESMALPKEAGAPIVARIKLLSGLQPGIGGVPQDGRFRAEANGERVSVKTSIVPTCHGEKATMRIAREHAAGLTLEHLGVHGSALERVHEALGKEAGSVIVAGPSGSGRTTTLYTMIDVVNAPEISVSTIEEQVEYQVPRVSQTQARPESGLTVAAGLRSILRQDPDVVMVGETKDLETAALSAHAASSGKLVLASVSAKSAAHAVSTLLGTGIDPSRLASSLSLVVGQRLVRRLADGAERKPLTRGQLAALGKAVDLDRVLGFLREEKVIGLKDGWDKARFGQARDGDASYKGSIGIFEALKASSAVRELVSKGATAAEIEARAKKEGMMTMLEAGIVAAAQGRTTIEEVLRAI